ncbi:MAG: signal transduction histidine kinase [Lentisphaeria bacterium]|jgi:signal transduction histidine kinase
MNAVLGFAQILQRDPRLLADQRQATVAIENSGNYLFELINDVLDISKIEAGNMALNLMAFDLLALLEGLAQMFSNRCRQRKLKWQFPTAAENAYTYKEIRPSSAKY